MLRGVDLVHEVSAGRGTQVPPKAHSRVQSLENELVDTVILLFDIHTSPVSLPGEALRGQDSARPGHGFERQPNRANPSTLSSASFR